MESAVHAAAASGNINVLRVILQSDLSLQHATDAAGNTLLHMAVMVCACSARAAQPLIHPSTAISTSHTIFSSPARGLT